MTEKPKRPINPLTNTKMTGRPRKTYDEDALLRVAYEPHDSQRDKGHPRYYHLEQLTSLQRRFCHEYIKDFDLKAAYFRAGGTSKTYSTQISKMLNKPKVAREIERLKQATLRHWDLNPNTIIKKVMDAYDGASACGQWGSAVKAAELLGKHVGMFDSDRNTTNVLVGINSGKSDNESLELDIKNMAELIKIAGVDKRLQDNELKLRELNPGRELDGSATVALNPPRSDSD